MVRSQKDPESFPFGLSIPLTFAILRSEQLRISVVAALMVKGRGFHVL